MRTLPVAISDHLEGLLFYVTASNYDDWQSLEEELLDEFEEDEVEEWGCEIGSRIEEWFGEQNDEGGDE